MHIQVICIHSAHIRIRFQTVLLSIYHTVYIQTLSVSQPNSLFSFFFHVQVAGYSPFADHANNDQMVICRNILKGEFEFPSHMKDKDVSVPRTTTQHYAQSL